MNNKLSDLNNHLFAQIERLSEEDIKSEVLSVEIDRAKAMAMVAKEIVGGAKVTLDALKMVSKGNLDRNDIPELLLLKNSIK